MLRRCRGCTKSGSSPPRLSAPSSRGLPSLSASRARMTLSALPSGVQSTVTAASPHASARYSSQRHLCTAGQSAQPPSMSSGARARTASLRARSASAAAQRRGAATHVSSRASRESASHLSSGAAEHSSDASPSMCARSPRRATGDGVCTARRARRGGAQRTQRPPRRRQARDAMTAAHPWVVLGDDLPLSHSHARTLSVVHAPKGARLIRALPGPPTARLRWSAALREKKESAPTHFARAEA